MFSFFRFIVSHGEIFWMVLHARTLPVHRVRVILRKNLPHFVCRLSESFLSPSPGIRNELPKASTSYFRSQLRCLSVGKSTSNIRMSSGTGQVEEIELVKIFGRLAEKMIFGDGSAGACCHSGCDDCEWRYSFDIMQAARPKWIPCYRFASWQKIP